MKHATVLRNTMRNIAKSYLKRESLNMNFGMVLGPSQVKKYLLNKNEMLVTYGIQFKLTDLED